MQKVLQFCDNPSAGRRNGLFSQQLTQPGKRHGICLERGKALTSTTVLAHSAGLAPMSKVAFSFLWCFVFFLPWDEVIHLPVWGSLPRVVGVVASVAGVLHIVARGRIRPPSWFNVLGLLFVLWAGASSFWSIDPDATRGRFLSYLQLLVLAWLIWEIAWSAERQRALLRAYVLGAGVAAVAIGY